MIFDLLQAWLPDTTALLLHDEQCFLVAS